MSIRLFVCSALFLFMSLVACKNQDTSSQQEPSQTETTNEDASAVGDKEHNSKYICPMYCEGSGSEEPGQCPVCEMDYVLNEKDSDDHSNHNHE